MKCVACGKAELVRDNQDISYTYKGQTIVIPNVGGEYCPACNESLHTVEESEYLNSEMLAFAKEVNRESVKPEFISQTRKLLKLDQRQAAELFGGGTNAFSRYESGKTRPPLALVQLFKLLTKHPELLKELKIADEEHGDGLPNKKRLLRRKKVLV
ncbi:MAG: type II toxin-antitoxin system MqsA family antitoxin [Candidatus Obscuribacterales bacterium]|nr:type II toxin-antitoxin system MqsA family antitoxin [Candidatus Obscuribacterales bacterium]